MLFATLFIINIFNSVLQRQETKVSRYHYASFDKVHVIFFKLTSAESDFHSLSPPVSDR